MLLQLRPDVEDEVQPSLPESIKSARQMGQEVLKMRKPSCHSFSSHAHGSLNKQCQMLQQMAGSWIWVCAFPAVVFEASVGRAREIRPFN